MRPIISINVNEPFLPIEEFCRRHALALSTARDMVRDGRLPVREKHSDMKRGRVFINMMALTVEALAKSNYEFSFNTQYE